MLVSIGNMDSATIAPVINVTTVNMNQTAALMTASATATTIKKKQKKKMTRHTAPQPQDQQQLIQDLLKSAQGAKELLEEGMKMMLAYQHQLVATQAECDRWRNIAMFNLTATYGDQAQHHLDTCYTADGTYHGGTDGNR